MPSEWRRFNMMTFLLLLLLRFLYMWLVPCTDPPMCFVIGTLFGWLMSVHRSVISSDHVTVFMFVEVLIKAFIIVDALSVENRQPEADELMTQQQ